MIPIYKPYFTKESLKYAHDAIDSTWISSHGKYLSIIKDKLKELLNVNYVILTNNGTSATHLISLALNYKRPNIENLIVPSNVYVAAWNMFLTSPRYNLIPIDADLNTWNLSYDKINNINYKNTALLGVHNIGNIIPIHKIQEKHPLLTIVEDNCEGIFGKYGNSMSGSLSLASSVSFFGNKAITSGEGGMFCTNNKDVFEYINKAKSHFITKEKFIFNGVGYNYRMTNVQAALLLGQLELLDEIQYKKKKIFEIYKRELKDFNNIHFQKIEEDTQHSYWMVGIRIDNFNKDDLDKFKLYLYENDIDTRPMFPPINYHGHLKSINGEFRNSKKLYESSLILPSYPDLKKNEIQYICNTIKQYFNE